MVDKNKLYEDMRRAYDPVGANLFRLSLEEKLKSNVITKEKYDKYLLEMSEQTQIILKYKSKLKLSNVIVDFSLGSDYRPELYEIEFLEPYTFNRDLLLDISNINNGNIRINESIIKDFRLSKSDMIPIDISISTLNLEIQSDYTLNELLVHHCFIKDMKEMSKIQSEVYERFKKRVTNGKLISTLDFHNAIVTITNVINIKIQIQCKEVMKQNNFNTDHTVLDYYGCDALSHINGISQAVFGIRCRCSDKSYKNNNFSDSDMKKLTKLVNEYLDILSLPLFSGEFRIKPVIADLQSVDVEIDHKTAKMFNRFFKDFYYAVKNILKSSVVTTFNTPKLKQSGIL
jgi:hypothetical protein